MVLHLDAAKLLTAWHASTWLAHSGAVVKWDFLVVLQLLGENFTSSWTLHQISTAFKLRYWSKDSDNSGVVHVMSLMPAGLIHRWMADPIANATKPNPCQRSKWDPSDMDPSNHLIITHHHDPTGSLMVYFGSQVGCCLQKMLCTRPWHPATAWQALKKCLRYMTFCVNCCGWIVQSKESTTQALKSINIVSNGSRYIKNPGVLI